jgi:hypothetical protein
MAVRAAKATKAEVRAYLEKTDLHANLPAVVNQTVQEQPADATARIAELLLANTGLTKNEEPKLPATLAAAVAVAAARSPNELADFLTRTLGAAAQTDAAAPASSTKSESARLRKKHTEAQLFTALTDARKVIGAKVAPAPASAGDREAVVQLVQLAKAEKEQLDEIEVKPFSDPIDVTRDNLNSHLGQYQGGALGKSHSVLVQTMPTICARVRRRTWRAST